jgi:NTE family protein
MNRRIHKLQERTHGRKQLLKSGYTIRVNKLMIVFVAGFFLTANAGQSSVPAASNTHSNASRPKIGVVLGGGGALGISHVGVLHVLEDMRIPIDYIGGTSMGAIIGGGYAAGMSPSEIQQLLESQDWWDILKDHTPRRDLDFRRKYDDQRYFIEFGWRNGGVAFGRGAASGQKFNNLLETATLRVSTITNFNELPVPFRAVTTDLTTGKELVLDHGHLATAMRASMAVPGIFTPVEWDGHILCDGMVVDNDPVNVVKAMGADIIIAVDLGGSAARAETNYTYDSLGQVLSRTYSITHRPAREAQLKQADVIIVPDLTGFSAGDFPRTSELVPQGVKAALEMEPQLKKYSVDEQTYKEYLSRQRREQPKVIPVSKIAVKGNHRVDTRVALGRIASKPGDPLDIEQVNEDLLHLYGLGEFDQVRYAVQPGPDGSNTLWYIMDEKSWGPNYIHVGLRLRSDFEQDSDWGLLLNIRKTSINHLAGEWNTDLEVGNTFQVFSEFYQPLSYKGYLFVDPSIGYTDETQGIYSNDHKVAEYEVQAFEVRGDVGVQFRHYAEVRGGPLWRKVKADVETGEPSLPEVDEDEGGLAVKLTVDRLDRTIFPREGFFAQVQSEFIGSPSSYEKFFADYKQCVSFGDHTLSAEGRIGTDFGSDLPAYNQFRIGGEDSFIGLAEGQLRGDKFGVATLIHRYRIKRLPPALGRALYSILRFDTGNVWKEPDDVDLNDLRYGGGVGLGADTAFGPLYVGFGLADRNVNRFYFSLGTVF